MWDTLSTLAIVAAAAVFIAQRLLRTPHCGGKDSGCHQCPQSGTEKTGREVDL